MSEGGGNPEELHSTPDRSNESGFRATLKRVAGFFRRTKTDSMAVEQGQFPKEVPAIPEKSGYQNLIAILKTYNDPFLNSAAVMELQVLYPDLLAKADSISQVPEEVKQAIQRELLNGNPTVIAGLAEFIRQNSIGMSDYKTIPERKRNDPVIRKGIFAGQLVDHMRKYLIFGRSEEEKHDINRRFQNDLIGIVDDNGWQKYIERAGLIRISDQMGDVVLDPSQPKVQQ